MDTTPAAYHCRPCERRRAEALRKQYLTFDQIDAAYPLRAARWLVAGEACCGDCARAQVDLCPAGQVPPVYARLPVNRAYATDDCDFLVMVVERTDGPGFRWLVQRRSPDGEQIGYVDCGVAPDAETAEEVALSTMRADAEWVA